jgi:hypothetical protein
MLESSPRRNTQPKHTLLQLDGRYRMSGELSRASNESISPLLLPAMLLPASDRESCGSSLVSQNFSSPLLGGS